MKVRVFQIFYKQEDDAWVPVDGDLVALAAKFASEELAGPVQFTDYKNLWAACEVDDDDKPIRCLGLLGMVLRADFPLCRFVDNIACLKLVERASDFLHDNGARGSEVFVRIDPTEAPEQMCIDRDKWLAAFKMAPANRWTFKIR